MCSKDAPQKMQFLGAIKKVASPVPWCQNAKWQKKISWITALEQEQIHISEFMG